MDILNLEAFSQIVAATKPYAEAFLRGNEANPQLGGTVRLYPAAKGTLVVAEVFGLPSRTLENGEVKGAGPFYALHIHDGRDCGSEGLPDPFKDSGTHYNPTDKQHPMHAGDLPPLLGDNGYAYLAVFTGRFSPDQVVGRTVVVHAHADDFRSQPSGDAGMKIACGGIKKI